MKHDQITRFVWEKEELRRMLIEDLKGQGFEIEGETKLTLHPLAVTLDLYGMGNEDQQESSHGQDEMFEQS